MALVVLIVIGACATALILGYLVAQAVLPFLTLPV